MRRTMLTNCLTAILLLMGAAAHGEERATLLCALGQVSECDPTGWCAGQSFDLVGLPRFVEVDFHDRIISELADVEAPRSTHIAQMTRTEEGIILQGVQLGRGWSVVITEAGGLTFSMADAQGMFVGSGACRPL
ncbi:MAG: hypothetical protein OEU36_12725 [Gammaproteobacteria bacterium]|nr:hypothetical protein [Gammaproteobacteria bacterium]